MVEFSTGDLQMLFRWAFAACRPLRMLVASVLTASSPLGLASRNCSCELIFAVPSVVPCAVISVELIWPARWLIVTAVFVTFASELEIVTSLPEVLMSDPETPVSVPATLTSALEI